MGKITICFVHYNLLFSHRQGDQGYCYIPYDYIGSKRLCNAAHTVTKLEDYDIEVEPWDEEDDVNYLAAAGTSENGDDDDDDDEDDVDIDDIETEDEEVGDDYDQDED